MNVGTQCSLNAVSKTLLQKSLPCVFSGRVTCHRRAGLDLALLLILIYI